MADPRKRLTRRERQIVEAVYRLGDATVAEVQEEIADPPGYDSVRTMMRLLEEKGVLRHRRDGQRYVYRPVVEKAQARQGALRELVRTFFDGSAEAAALALLKLERGEPTDAELARLRRLLEENAAAEEGGQ
jgi:predicted transcriptional regulator